ncbi:MAG: TolC family protein [Bacillota bacterium]
MKNNKYILIISVFFLISIFSTSIIAAEYSLEELIVYGINNNTDINNIQSEIQTTKRNIKLNNAQVDWQANMNLNKVLVDGDTVSLNRDGDQLSVGINKKLAEDNLTVSPNMSYDFDGTDFIYGLDLSLDVYPNIPSERIRTLINLNNQLNQKQKELNSKKAELVKKWTEQYLQLVRINQNKNVLEKRLQLAEDNYSEVEKQVEINEAGQQVLLDTELNLKDAEYNLKEVNQQYAQLKRSLLNTVNLAKDTKIILDENNSVIKRLQELTNNLSIDNLDKEKLIKNVVKNSSQFASIINRNELLKNELNWLEKENNPQVSIDGQYNSETDFQASLNVTFNLFDSGVQEIKEENKKQEINNNKLALDQLYSDTENSLEQIIDQIELSKMDLERKELNYRKTSDNVEIITKQFEAGAVEKRILTDNELSEESGLINLKRSKDSLLLNKLDILIFSSPDDIVEEVNR